MFGVEPICTALQVVGVTVFSWAAVRFGFARLPGGVRWGHIVGVGAVAGIGFTVSLFITGLAFDDVGLQDDAKIGTLAASIIAAVVGAAVLTLVARRQASSEQEPEIIGTDEAAAALSAG